MNKSKKITSTSPKFVGVPKTSQEKYDYFKKKNPEIENFKNAFDLDIEL